MTDSREDPETARLPAEHPLREEIVARHRAAIDAGDAGYLDPSTGLFVLTAAYHLARGTCCEQNCRHCPYLR